ncbi:Crinkler (CRN) [Phytophthora megakarya]|uniref:Crinkler (CRN) n=1 Tax=Phytophthora megakarya TaxID=4795 RepID=A0A225VYL5_9STRA|nr:Crinkler (CRN) [Phytophthora megakarya]
MVNLACGIVGEVGDTFHVNIDEHKSVVALMDAILAKAPNAMRNIDANQMQLFPAKYVDTVSTIHADESMLTWLSSDSEDAKKLRVGRKTDLINVLTKENFMMLGEHPVEEYLAGVETPKMQQIHVLVMIPKRESNLATAQSKRKLIVDAILYHMLYPPIAKTHKKNFKHNVCKFYGCYHREKTWVRCMLLDIDFPKALVVASHLFQRSKEYLAQVMMQMSDIDDMRNGLLLFIPLQYAFAHFQVGFIRHGDTDTFRLKLFDPRLRDTRLIDIEESDTGVKVLNEEQLDVLRDVVSMAERPCQFDVKTTFGDMDGKTLVFTGYERPFCRCLNLQARLARMVALNKGWIDASYDFADFWSEVSLEDVVELTARDTLGHV